MAYSTRTCWEQMTARCYNPNNTAYKNYGGRGIKICERWRGYYNNFVKDMGIRPSKKFSIDRIDNDKGYSPENCRWATMKTQQNNRSNNRMITANGVTLNLMQWSERTKIDFKLIHARLSRGYKPEEALGLAPRIQVRTCPLCNKKFQVTGRRRYCSANCRSNYWWHRQNPESGYRIMHG